MITNKRFTQKIKYYPRKFSWVIGVERVGGFLSWPHDFVSCLVVECEAKRRHAHAGPRAARARAWNDCSDDLLVSLNKPCSDDPCQTPHDRQTLGRMLLKHSHQAICVNLYHPAFLYTFRFSRVQIRLYE